MAPLVCSKQCLAAVNAQRVARPFRCQQTIASHTSDVKPINRRALLSLVGGSAMLLVGQHAAQADEGLPNPAAALVGTLERTEEDLRFEATDIVQSLLRRSEENRDKNRKELQDKYCLRQAEDGVGDCAGLQLIPGMTKNGKQKTPGFLKKIFGSGDKDDE